MTDARAPTYVTTTPAAEAIGVHPVTLWRYYREGLVTPARVTARGQTRWDIEDLKRQIAAMSPKGRRKIKVTRKRFERLPLGVYIDGVLVEEEEGGGELRSPNTV